MEVSYNGGTPKSFMLDWDFPFWTIQLRGYPHDSGNPHINHLRQDQAPKPVWWPSGGAGAVHCRAQTMVEESYSCDRDEDMGLVLKNTYANM